MDREDRVNRLLTQGYQFNLNKYLKQAFDFAKNNFQFFLVFGVIYVLISMVFSRIPPIGIALNLIISAPLSAGFFISIHKIINNNQVGISDLFSGFHFFVPLVLLQVVSSLFIFSGLFLFIIPGIYFAVSYIFAPYFVVFWNMDFWSAMELSRKIVTKNFINVLSLFILITIFNIAGILLFGVGLILTMPFTILIVYFAFNDILYSENYQEESTNDFSYFR